MYRYFGDRRAETPQFRHARWSLALQSSQEAKSRFKTRFLATLEMTALFFLISASILTAFGEITIAEVRLQETPPFQYKVLGTAANQTAEAREVVLRAQIVFYDKSAPKGDVPVHVLRKDLTVVLRGAETRNIEVVFFKEGHFPDVRLRAEPELRIRRQRLWINRYEDTNPSKS